ncbi:MAG: pantoate--beta-alanine ligase [Candidatus Methylacidiphilales bacterium]
MQRQAAAWRLAGLKIGLVPTMGALHEGHLSLVRRARKEADRVAVSIYVNPTQFGPKEDFARYPRPRSRDLALCRAEGVDVVFAPSNLYRPDASTKVVESDRSLGRCGNFRSGHFEGVATVVVKLFNLVQPDVAVFGQKDAQQCDVIERVVRDLNIPVRIVRGPIVRDQNGLALSSRNAYLSQKEMEIALNLPRVLRTVKSKPNMTNWQRERLARELLSRVDGLTLDYAEVVGPYLCAAVRVGRTRLIDNVRIPRSA